MEDDTGGSGNRADGLVRRTLAVVRGGFDWNEFTVLAALAVCAGGLFAFAAIVDEVLEGETDYFDRAILSALRAADDPADPVGPQWLEVVFRDLTALGGYTVITTIAIFAVGFLALLRRWRTIALFVLALVGGTILNNVLKYTIERPRPDLVNHLVEVQTLSLPSGHAMLSAVAYLTLGALVAQFQTSWSLKFYVVAAGVVLTILVGVSRVYLGVHWPTDVLAGWCIGAAWAMAFWLLARYLDRER